MADIEYADFVAILSTMSSPDYAADYLVIKKASDGSIQRIVPNNLINRSSTTDVLTGTATLSAVTPDALAALWEQGADIASATTISVGEGGYFHVTGTTGITDIDFATDKAGRAVKIVFDGILTLTHSSTLILPTGANITTAAGDSAIFVSEGSDIVRCVGYLRADGSSLAGGGLTGSGTTNRMSKWTSSTALGDALLSSNTTDVSPTTAGTIGLGTNALPFSSVFIGNAATNNIQLTGTATGARVITLPDATGTLAISPLTTKGDLWGFSTVNARIPVGADGYVIQADSTNPLGVAWNTPRILLDTPFQSVVGGTLAYNSVTQLRWSTALGYNAGLNRLHSNEEVYIGWESGKGSTTGLRNTWGNVAVGARTLNRVVGVDNDYNTAIGSYAGEHLTTGSFNVLLGWDTGNSITTGSNNVFVGPGAGDNDNGVEFNYCLFLGPYVGEDPVIGSQTGLILIDAGQFTPNNLDALIYGEGDNDILEINGTFRVRPGATHASSVKLEIDDSAVANNTSMQVWDVTAATLQRVTIGAADSGGAGFRVLRIPN